MSLYLFIILILKLLKKSKRKKSKLNRKINNLQKVIRRLTTENSKLKIQNAALKKPFDVNGDLNWFAYNVLLYDD